MEDLPLAPLPEARTSAAGDPSGDDGVGGRGYAGMEAARGEAKEGPESSSQGLVRPRATEAMRLPCLSDGCVKAAQRGVEVRRWRQR